jgi:hypothetical protein
MKRLFALSIGVFMFFAAPNNAQNKGFGIGIMIGQPTGFTAKNWMNGNNAIDFALGFSFARNYSGVNMHSDYLWHSYNAIQSTEKFVLYYGPGLSLRTGKNGNGQFGIRGELGLEWMSHSVPIDVFIEIAPVFNFIATTGFNIDAGFGARYYFE